MAIKKTTLKGILLTTGETLTIALSGLFKTIAEKNLKGHEKELVEIILQKPTSDKSVKQNRLLHALIDKDFISGTFNYEDVISKRPENRAELKIMVKFAYGLSYEIKDPIALAQIDREGKGLETKYGVYFLISWGKYKMNEAQLTLNGYMNNLIERGVDIDQEKVLYEDLYKKPFEKPKPELPIF